MIGESNILIQDELFRRTMKKIWIPWSSQGMTDFVALMQVIATQFQSLTYDAAGEYRMLAHYPSSGFIDLTILFFLKY